MRVGLFSVLVDRIQHAYGWDDETVLNLTVARAVQINESIKQRESLARWEQRRVLEWQTRNLAIATVQVSMADPDAKKDLIDHYKYVSLDATNKANDTSKRNKGKAKQGKTYKTVDGKEVSASELSQYSYEEIDHSASEQASIARARQKNAGTSLAGMTGSFTR